jgi:hypothetical protein
MFTQDNVLEWSDMFTQDLFHLIKKIACSFLDTAGIFLITGQWFSSGTPISSNNKTDRNDITEILMKMALNTLSLNQTIPETNLLNNPTKLSRF